MDYVDLLELKLHQECKDISLDSMIQAIDTLKSTQWWDSKNTRLAKLNESSEVARQLLFNTVGFNQQIQELLGKLATKLSKCSYEEQLANASDVIQACEGLHYEAVLGEHIMIESNYILESSTYEYIALRNYAPPMLVEPKKWQANDDGGYYDTPLHCVLGSMHNRHDKPQALDVLNMLQEIKWKLNPLILEQEHQPNKEFKSPDSHKQFRKFVDDSKDTYAKYADIPLWFIWQFDKRGRMYSLGYHINLQSDGYNKALLDFNDEEDITGEL